MNPLIITLALLHVTDISMTYSGMVKQGGREANPFLPKNPFGVVAITTAESTSQIYLLHKVEKNHPKLAKGLMLMTIGAEGFITYHNAQQIKFR